jgi:predicted short-subunit dehydrogenase-like oxidoreductase (DUF2520 family)
MAAMHAYHVFGRSFMPDKPHIVVIGPGTVGETLAVLASKAGYRVVGVAARSIEHAMAAAERVGPTVRVGTAEEIAPAGGLVLLTVGDDAIEPLCRLLAAKGCFTRGSIVAHCSGALPSGILAPARELCGAHIASMHPFQTFPNVQAGLERFGGTYCFIEGDAPAVAALHALAAALGGHPVTITSQGKPLYHSAAVFASNYLNAVLDAAMTAADKAGISADDAAAALAPLVKATLANIRQFGTAKALTGPIARGDAQLVARQYRDVASADAKLGELYRHLGDWTVDIALRGGNIDQEQAQQIRRSLDL